METHADWVGSVPGNGLTGSRDPWGWLSIDGGHGAGSGFGGGVGHGEGAGEGVDGEVAAPFSPFFVLVGEDSAVEADGRVSVGESGPFHDFSTKHILFSQLCGLGSDAGQLSSEIAHCS